MISGETAITNFFKIKIKNILNLSNLNSKLDDLNVTCKQLT